MKSILSVVLLGIFCLDPVNSTTLDIKLSNYDPYDLNLYERYYAISDDSNEIVISDVQDQVGFLIVQVHSYLENVTLSSTMQTALSTSITGKNVGLVWEAGANTPKFYLLKNNKCVAHIKLVVTLYDESAPVPGGCNLSFNTPTAPYQLISYNDEYITVKSQAPSADGVSCDDNKVQIEMYHLYLSEHDNTNTTYFDGIEKMLTVDQIRLHGTKVFKDEGYFKYNRLFSNYRSVGSVYAIVATYNNKSSAYVPAVSYGCDETNWDLNCIGPVTVHWRIIMSCLFLFGLFICFCGHRFFRFTLLMVGFTFGVFVTYCIVSLDDTSSSFEKTMTSICVGFLYGIFWSCLWCKCGVPLLSVHLAISLSGFLLASVIFYAGIADHEKFVNNWNYFTTFLIILAVYVIVWIPITMHAHIFASSFLGSYAGVTALNYYIGGNLQYIVINTYRRISVKNFNFAVIDPPFQFLDVLHCIFWLIFLFGGLFVQLKGQRNRPPFPPNGCLMGVNRDTERTPLIIPEYLQPPPYQYHWDIY